MDVKNYHVHQRRMPLILIAVFLCCFSLKAQDIHFAQFYNSPLNISPALTGVFKGDRRFIGNYRSQWQSALVPYTTFSGMFDSKIYSDKFKNGMLGAGAVLNYDIAGDGELGNIQLNASVSYTLTIDRENFLSFGLQAGVAQRSFRPASLTFDNQFDGEIFDPSRPINEQFTNTAKVYGDVSIGVNWHGQKQKKRTRLDVGGAVYHLNQPDQSFNSADPARLSTRISLYMLPTLQLSKKMDFILHGMAQLQGAYTEGFAGAGGRFHLDTRRTREMAIQLTGSYRFNAFGDSVIPAAEVHYKTWVVGLSYDINISDFQRATNRYGGPELSVRYTITNVKPVNTFKICPII